MFFIVKDAILCILFYCTENFLLMSGKIAPEMRIFSPEGEPLYLNQDERRRFMAAVRKDTDRDAVMFCTLLHYTGARPTELRELTIDRINVDTSEIHLRSIKKRKQDSKGNKKLPQYRTIPIPENVMNMVVLTFDVLSKQKKGSKSLLWHANRSLRKPIDAATAYRWVKRNMSAANITGKKASAKGLRHGFAINMVLKNIPINIIKDLMGHTSSQTTEIYLTAMGGEKKDLILSAWDD